MHFLIIEHEHKLAAAINKVLEASQHTSDIAYDGKSGWLKAKNNQYDLIVADLMAPGKPDTTGLLRKLRTAGRHTPVLVLIPKSNIAEAYLQLSAGADDFLVKPFTLSELVARVKALTGALKPSDKKILEYEDLKLDTSSFLAQRAGKTIVLTSREFALLEFLMLNADNTVTKENIISHVWNYDSVIRPNTLEVYIGYLRSKIDEPFDGPRLINTRRGFGYYLGKLK